MPIASEKATSAWAAAKWRRKRQAKRVRERGWCARDSYMSGPPSKREAHESYDGDVEDERRDPDPGHVARKLVELERYIDRAAHRREPFAPDAIAPQAVGLGEANECVHHHQCGDEPQLRIARIFQDAVEDVRIALARIEMKASDQLD